MARPFAMNAVWLQPKFNRLTVDPFDFAIAVVFRFSIMNAHLLSFSIRRRFSIASISFLPERNASKNVR
jgi:hypothetical protein